MTAVSTPHATPGRMSRDDFHRWLAVQPDGVPYERIDGVPMAMAPERVGHNRLKRRVWQLLDQAVADRGLPCEALIDGITVEIGDDLDYEPDAVVHCGEALDADATAVTHPVVVVEVLSPGTRSKDTGAKLVDYFSLASVQHYLIVHADRPRVLHHRRGDDGLILTRIYTGGHVELAPPGFTLDIDALYRPSASGPPAG
jgi:Uma2 family endonuclease